MAWSTENDFLSDLYGANDRPLDHTPPTQSRQNSDISKKARGRLSIYDEDQDVSPNSKLQKTCIKTPQRGALSQRSGNSRVSLEDILHRKQTEMDIREVSGLGFSNELCERFVRCNETQTKPTVMFVPKEVIEEKDKTIEID